MNARKLDEFHLLAEQRLAELLDKFDNLWMEGRQRTLGGGVPPEDDAEEEEIIPGLS